jgi:hypothetical protein
LRLYADKSAIYWLRLCLFNTISTGPQRAQKFLASLLFKRRPVPFSQTESIAENDASSDLIDEEGTLMEHGKFSFDSTEEIAIDTELEIEITGVGP